MDSPNGNCDSCGAPAAGLICGHCGKPATHLSNASEEDRALDEFHNLLQGLKPEDQRSWLLTSGFIPDHKGVLIEAGIRCLPLLQDMKIYDAAASRLEAIITKLKLLHGDRQAALAVEDFRAKIEGYKVEKRKNNYLTAGCLLAIIAAVVGVGWWLVWGFGWNVAVPVIAGIVLIILWLIFKK
jgi:hypothetical protein